MGSRSRIFVFLVAWSCCFAQASAVAAEQDQQSMMTRLGIRALRPGPSGDENAPNHANYDEALANPYPRLPDPLVLNDGRRVTSAQMWWSERRPQIVAEFEQHVYGRIPSHVPPVTWRITASERDRVGGVPVTISRLVGHVDNASYPLIDVSLSMTLVLPANAGKPVPVLMMFGPTNFPAPPQPTPAELRRINAALEKALVGVDPSLADVFRRNFFYQPIAPVPFAPTQQNADGDPPSTDELIAAGWGFALLDPQSAQPDNGAGLTRGIIGLVNHGQPRKPEDWGALRAWAWAASRGLDYLRTNPAVDGSHVGIEGVSRYGKAALVTMAFDPRFAMVLVGSSGKGGATLLRRNFGEAVESLTGGEYYWMAGNFMKYGASEASFGSGNPGQIPVDSHELIALCAPRLTFLSYGIPERGDARWLDHRGSFMAAVAAQPVFRLLGAKGMGVPDDYLSARMPPVNHGLLGGQLAWRQDDGGHTDAPNVKYFIEWVDRFIQHGSTPGEEGAGATSENSAPSSHASSSHGVSSTADAAVAGPSELTFTAFRADGVYAPGKRVGWTVTRAPGAGLPQDRYSYTVIRDENAIVKTGAFDLSSGSAEIELSSVSPASFRVIVDRIASPSPHPLTGEEARAINEGIRRLLTETDPSLRGVLEKYPGYRFVPAAHFDFTGLREHRVATLRAAARAPEP
jgi:(4-O-methyl)-D-glucuronate---lignin esterase